MDRDRYDHDEIVGRADPRMSVGGGFAGLPEADDIGGSLGEAELEVALTNLEAAVTGLARQAKASAEAAEKRGARIEAMLAKVDESLAWLSDA